jgi:protein SCO1/2
MQCKGTIRRNWRNAARAATAAIVLCIAFQAPAVLAQVSSYGDKSEGPANDSRRRFWAEWGFRSDLNQQLPLNLAFTDDAGKQVLLGDYFGKRPAILALVYYRCPMLCSEEMDGLTSALQMVRFVPGKDFNIDCGEHRSH